MTPIELNLHFNGTDEETNQKFKTYMFYRLMVIDVWNADSNRHLGSVSLPMRKIMRNGQKQKVLKEKFEINMDDKVVGELEMQFTNDGNLGDQQMPLKQTVTLN